MPATVPSIGESELPRPVYRAYDVGVEFNENYVELMYRLDGRDLGLYLYDNNNRPIRDARGRLILIGNRWGRSDQLALTESEVRWISIINSSNCVKSTIDQQQIPHDNILISDASNQILDLDTIYEARLIPLLLHEDFHSFTLNSVYNDAPGESVERWAVVDQGNYNSPSRWEIHKEDQR